MSNRELVLSLDTHMHSAGVSLAQWKRLTVYIVFQHQDIEKGACSDGGEQFSNCKLLCHSLVFMIKLSFVIVAG